MSISRSEVLKIAALARLRLAPAEEESFEQQLSSILRYTEQLGEVDTREAEPLSHVLPMHNVWREDVPSPSLPADEALDNAPDRSGMTYRVPRIIE